MKKKLLLLLLLLIPIISFAETCDESKIKIESINLSSLEGSTEEKNDPVINGKKINLNLNMSKVGDSALYTVKVKNESDEEYLLDESSLTKESDYIVYSLETDDDKIIKPKEEKSVSLRVKYNKEVAESDFKDGVYQDNKQLVVNLSTGNDAIENNPKTGKSILMFISVLILVIGSTIVIKNKKAKYIILLLSLTLPFTVNAICNISLNVESDVTISKTSKFYLKIVSCREFVNDTFEFEEGMTVKEWTESKYIQKFVEQRIKILKTDSETRDYYINISDEEIEEFIRSDTLDYIVDRITNDENYVIQPNDRLIYDSPLC